MQKELGINETKFHAFRGCFITHLLLQNVSVIKIQQMVGHDDLKTTLYYIGLIGKELEGATEGISIDFENIAQLGKFREEKKKA